MCDRRRIHVFLGAPPPPSGHPSQTASRTPATWRHLQLRWRDGRLSRAAGHLERRMSREADRIEKDGTHRDHLTHQGTDPAPRVDGPDMSEESDTEDEGQCSTSLHQYLDSNFPTAHPAPGPEPEPRQTPRSGPASQTEDQQPPMVAPPSNHTQYLTTWTMSQVLVLKSHHGIQSASSPEKTPSKDPVWPPFIPSDTPALYRQPSPSLEPSVELFSHTCSSPILEEGGVFLQVTTEGVLCSQESEIIHESLRKSPIKSSSKRPGLSDEFKTGAPEGPTISAPLHTITTLLPQCDRPGVRYSVLVVVVHPCHLKEVKVKSGLLEGTLIPLASIVVMDQSGMDRKIVLWRRAAFWAVTLSPGDVVFMTGLQVTEDRWRGEMLLQSTFSSQLLNLGHVTSSASRPVTQVDPHLLSSLCDFVRKRRPMLAALLPPPPQHLARLPYALLRSLRVNTLVHALLRVTHTHFSSEWRCEVESSSRSASRKNVVITVEQADGQQGVLLLWGAAVDWLPRFNRERDAIWDFHLLLVRNSVTSDLPELHSTPWSWVQALEPSDSRAQNFLQPRCEPSKLRGAVELDLDTLLSQKYTGEVELHLQVFAFHFQDPPTSQNAPQLVMDGFTTPGSIEAVLSGNITFMGCGRCAAELDIDANGIYYPCYPCLPHNTVQRYYRPAVLTVGGKSVCRVKLKVPPEPLQRILSTPPDQLNGTAGCSLKNIQLAAARISSLLALPRKTFIIKAQSHFLLDENNATIHQEFRLLYLHMPECLL